MKYVPRRNCVTLIITMSLALVTDFNNFLHFTISNDQHIYLE